MSNATIIGSASEFNGVTTFKSQPIITSTILANTDSSTNIATTAWSNAFWTYVKTQANTWSGAQTFTTTTTDTITAPTITSNMTIGSNLNGGSVAIGATSTTTINGVTAINIGTSETQTGNIAIGTNNAVLSGTNQIFIGASNKTTNISGSAINIGNTGLSATGVVNIASGTNVAGSEVNIGSTSLTAVNIRSVQTNVESTTLNLNTNGTGNTLIGTSGGSNSITFNRPLTIGYTPSFTTSQIGYSSSSTVSGALVSGTTNTLLMGTLTGVYMVTVLSEVGAGNFVGITSYDFQLGLNGVGYKSRIFVAGNPSYSNNQQTIPYVYSSGGTPNPTSALLYSSINLNFGGSTGTSPFWALTLYYTRVA